MMRRVIWHSVLGLFAVLVASAAGGLASEPLTAIDILLLPDQTMIDHAEAANARLRENYPQGFSLDAKHHPHITLFQGYVRTADRDQVYAAVERVFDARRPAGWELEAVGYYFLNFEGRALAGIVIQPTPDLRALQNAIVEAVRPYAVPRGTSAAFVTTPDDPDVNAPTLQYVDMFVPQRTGKNFNPHVTIGVGEIEFVQQMKSAAFPRFQFKVAGAAVYHLGNYGTAAQQLWAWEHAAAE
jgi:2'-5' RNA ligase